MKDEAHSTLSKHAQEGTARPVVAPLSQLSRRHYLKYKIMAKQMYGIGERNHRLQ